MAALQTHVLVGDQWVTQTITAEELIGDNARSKPVEPPPPKPPKYGVLTKTVIESPVIRWVLPVQLRSSRFNDVALVGDQSVQICELGTDMQLLPVGKKVKFDSSIRNCRVMGTHDYLRQSRQDAHANYYGNFDFDMASPSPIPKDIELFQQVLILALSSGELVFIFMNLSADGKWEFVSSHFPIFGGKLVKPGFHMTISPDGEYLALACSEDLFIVYQLTSIWELRRQHNTGSPIQPIRSAQARPMRGIVHKIEFLHPNAENISHTILLLITVRSGILRLVVYEWDNSEPLKHALAAEKSGHRLDGAAGLPLLIIPLTVYSQFLMITELSMAICSDFLSGPPNFDYFRLAHRDATEWHHGTHRPMWTAWTRPPREELYHADKDIIYLAREDGWVNCLEILDESGVGGSIYMGPLECNIDSAFSSLSTSYGELLVAGGDFGPGAIWIVQARQSPKRIGPLHNWSPTVDLVLMKDAGDNARPAHTLSKQPSLTEKMQEHLLAPERIFACSGRDKFGAIVELRYGIQAKIGLDLSYPTPVKRCWAIPCFEDSPEAGFLMLLALPENSALLHISHDLSEVSEKSQDVTDFDLLSTTLAVYVFNDIVVQITSTQVTIMSPNDCYSHLISDMIGNPLATLTDAVITDGILALSVYSDSSFRIMVYTLDGFRFVLNQVVEVNGEVNTLSIEALSAGVCVLAGLSRKDSLSLAIFLIKPSEFHTNSLTVTQGKPMEIKLQEDDAGSVGTNAVTSIICLDDDKIAIGMRNGDVLTICLADNGQPVQESTQIRRNNFGVSSSHVFAGTIFDSGPSTLVCNDAGLAIMKEPDAKQVPGCVEEIYRIWLTDANEPQLPSPAINSIARLHNMPDYSDSTLIMIAGTHILVTELQPRPAPVPRYMPTGGTPSKILYSERLKALVTVVVKTGIPSLHFFDPLTGADLSRPMRKVSEQGNEQYIDIDYVSNLGNSDVKVTSLLTWSYINNGHAYEWFVLLAKSGDDQGRLIIISAEQETTVTDTGPSRQIRFWTQFYRRTRDGPPRCGTSDKDGLLLSFGKTIEYHIIEDKKFKTAMKYELPSPAMCLEVAGGYLHALTSHHSLVVLDYKSSTRMIQIHTDEVARNGLYSMDVGSALGLGERERFSLMSDPMCSVYGLWSPNRSLLSASTMQLVFRADLPVSIRKFVSGHTGPRWTKDQPRCTHVQDVSARPTILGLAVDGSLTQFSIIHEDVWRLLRFIQNLAMMSIEICLVPRENDSGNDLELNPRSSPKTKMHVDGDILQRCLEQRALERIMSSQQLLARFEELVNELDVELDMPKDQAFSGASLAYEKAYSILEYYLSPAV